MQEKLKIIHKLLNNRQLSDYLGVMRHIYVESSDLGEVFEPGYHLGLLELVEGDNHQMIIVAVEPEGHVFPLYMMKHHTFNKLLDAAEAVLADIESLGTSLPGQD